MDEPEAPKPQNSFMIFGRRLTVSDAILVAALTVMGGIVGSWISLLTKDHELKIRLVEIGIGILRADPKENLTPAREWAIRVIEKNSSFDFSEEDKRLLLNKPILYRGGIDDSYYGYDASYDSGSAPKKPIRPTPTETPK